MTMATTNSKFLADLHEQALADCPAADDRRESWRSFTVAGLPENPTRRFGTQDCLILLRRSSPKVIQRPMLTLRRLTSTRMGRCWSL